jgi:hypothetical protein
LKYIFLSKISFFMFFNYFNMIIDNIKNKFFKNKKVLF